jgi:hypothetical protein
LIEGLQMLLKRRINSRTIIAVGLALIALANVSQFLITRHHVLSEDFGDGVSGFLFGVAIGTTLLGVYLRGRELREGSRYTR